jgi:hypothetical protein
LLTPDARPVAVAPLNQSLATDPVRLAELMERVAQDLDISRGDPVVKPSPQSAPPRSEPDSLVLHLTARYLERSNDDLVPVNATSVLGTQKAGNWGNLPSEDWIVLTKQEWMKLLPAAELQPDSKWELDREVCAKVLRHFFPPTENTEVDTNRIDEQALFAHIESIEGGVVSVRLEGRFKMKHPFYHKDDKNFVEATVVGIMDIETSKQRIRSIRLVTDQAAYGASGGGVQFFGVAVRSSP